MLDVSVGARKEQALAAVRPAHQIRASATFSDLQDFAVSARPVQRPRGHHDPIADFRLHLTLLYIVRGLPWLPPA